MEVHVLAVDDSVIDRRVIESLLKTSSYKGMFSLYICVWVYVCMYNTCMHACMCMIYVCIIHACMHVHDVCMNICMHACMYIFMHAFIHICDDRMSLMYS